VVGTFCGANFFVYGGVTWHSPARQNHLVPNNASKNKKKEKKKKLRKKEKKGKKREEAVEK
jgi:hypothetical protein